MTTPADQPADPIAAGDTTTPAPAASPTDATAAAQPVPAPDQTSNDDRIAQLEQLVAQLSNDLAARPPASSPVAPITSTAPAGGPAPAAVAPGVPAHSTSNSLDGAQPGDFIRYAGVPGPGGEPQSGYALVLDVVDVDDNTGGTAQDGQPSHPELVVARLDVLGVRLQAEHVVDEEASARVQAQLDQQG